MTFEHYMRFVNQGVTMEEVMRKNVFKLCDRYPRLHGLPEDVIAGRDY